MLGVPKDAQQTWITKLASRKEVHALIRVLRLQAIAGQVFKVVPLRRRLKSGIPYRVRWLESLLTADEIFSREIYGAAFADREIKTFIDVGCNVGYFPLYAAERTGRKDLRGLVVDGNEEMARESKWHVDQAGLSQTRVRHGLVGYPADVKEATFYVNPSNVASSAQPELNPNVPSKGESRAMTVPVVNLHEEWKKLAGDQRIDLLKIDVEGFECELLQNCRDVIALTDRIVLEWHKWVTTQAEVEKLLAEQGFRLRALISEDEHAGVAVYDRAPAN